MLAFYGEEETRNFDSPEPGLLEEKDDVATKPMDETPQVCTVITCICIL